MSDSERTDADDGGTAQNPPTSELDKVLDSLKRPRPGADDLDVTSDVHARMSWSSVTEAEPEPTPPSNPSESSFRFDLGSALARLGGEQPSPLTDEPSASDAIDDHPPAPDAASATIAPTAAPPEPLTRPPQPEPLTEPPTEPPTDPLPDEPVVEPGGELPTRRPTAESAGEPTVEPTIEPGGELPTRRPPVEPTGELPTRRPSVAPSPGTVPPLQRRVSSPPPEQPAPERTAPAGVGDAAVGSARQSAPIVAEPSTRAPSAASQRSVFEDAAPAPALPTSPQRMPTVEPSAPIIPPGALPNLPTLPPAVPAAAPVTTESLAVGPTTPDINAVRSYQLRAQRDQRRNKVVGRTLLVVLLLAAGVAAALFFGRSYLYPTEWDPALTPIVDQVQLAHGDEFTDEVPLETLENGEYAAIVLALTVGDEWADRLPEWRALGVATGAADSASIVDATVAWRPAVYDPATDTVYRAADADPAAVDAALVAALEEVFARQHGTPPNNEFGDATPGVVGVSSLERINSRSIDRALLVGPGDAAIVDGADGVPLPLLYEFAATDILGAPLVDAAGAAADGWAYGDIYPSTTLTATAVPYIRATPGAVPPDVESLGEPVALGRDNWSLIWASRLPGSTVDRLATIVTADAYRPVRRGDTRCFVADLQATSDSTATEVLGAAARWLAVGPSSANGSATLVSPTIVEIVACDPGAESVIGIDPAAVTGLLDRQQARL